MDTTLEQPKQPKEAYPCTPHFTWIPFRLSYRQAARYSPAITRIVQQFAVYLLVQQQQQEGAH